MQRKNILITAALAAVTFICNAQNYVIYPDDSIVATAPLENLTVFNIQQNNITTDTLHISWEKVTDILPAMWSAQICDNAFCYPDLHQGGIMDVFPTGYGLLSLHITPHVNPGTAIIQYAVWETNNPLLKDTLTWIISATTTGISEVQQNPFAVYNFANTLHIQKNNRDVNKIRIFDMNGKISKEFFLIVNKMQFDISDLAKGIYFVQATGNNSDFTKKIKIY